MKLLVIGSGAREHAIAWKLAQSPLVNEIFVAPGNPGIALEKNKIKVVAAFDFDSWLALVKNEAIDFVVVGPDQALADGVVDFFEQHKIKCFGPTKAQSRLEWSKVYAKNLMRTAGIPTAKFSTFSSAEEAKLFLERQSWKTGWVIKADGLALGKGVIVCEEKEQAQVALQELSQLSAAKELVIEEKLSGREVSAFFLCDGKSSVPFGFACDHKQLLDGGQGPNTGGMGAYSPAAWTEINLAIMVQSRIVQPLLRRVPFKGMLFIGLMITPEGPQVIEFNARFGDPETQALLPLLAEDLFPWLQASTEGTLDKMPRSGPRFISETAVHVVLAAEGYPGKNVARGDAIEQGEISEAKLFYAGVKQGESGLQSNGGRVLGITALGKTRDEARRKAYEALGKVQFRGMQFRRDIGV